MHRQLRGPASPPTSSSRVLPAPASRWQRAAKASAVRISGDDARQPLSAAAAATTRGRCGPLSAGRDAPVLEAVDFSQDWQNGRPSAEQGRHLSSANGNGSSAEPSSLAHAAAVETDSAPSAEAASVAAGDIAGAAVSNAASSVANGVPDHAVEGLSTASASAAMGGAADSAAPGTGAVGQDAQQFQGLGELVDIEELRGVRVSVDGNGKAVVEYLVHWKARLLDLLGIAHARSCSLTHGKSTCCILTSRLRRMFLPVVRSQTCSCRVKGCPRVAKSFAVKTEASRAGG